MVVVSYSGKEINAKLVYYGPGLSGKTTNLEYIYQSVPNSNRGKMVSMKTRTERTLFFDFLPVDLGEMGGFKTRFLLYTVPGQVYYNATRKLVLRGVDAIIFVADSARGKMDENLESLRNLHDNLKEYGLSLDEIPFVVQYNKRDIEDVYSVEELEQALNPTGAPYYEAVATTGQGVFETFRGIARVLLQKLSKEIKVGEGRSLEAKSAALASPAEPAAPGRKTEAPAPVPPAPAPVAETPSFTKPPRPELVRASEPVPVPETQAGPVRGAEPDPEPRPEAETEPLGAGDGAQETPAETPAPARRSPYGPPRRPASPPAPEPRAPEPVAEEHAEPGKPAPAPEAVEARPEPALPSPPEPVREPETVTAQQRTAMAARPRPDSAADPEERPGFWGRLFGRGNKEEQGAGASPATREARLAPVELPAVGGSGDASPVFIERRIQVPITLGPEEMVRGARLRLVLEIQVEASGESGSKVA